MWTMLLKGLFRSTGLKHSRSDRLACSLSRSSCSTYLCSPTASGMTGIRKGWECMSLQDRCLCRSAVRELEATSVSLSAVTRLAVQRSAAPSRLRTISAQPTPVSPIHTSPSCTPLLRPPSLLFLTVTTSITQSRFSSTSSRLILTASFGT